MWLRCSLDLTGPVGVIHRLARVLVERAGAWLDESSQDALTKREMAVRNQAVHEQAVPVWMEVIALLTEAADLGAAQIGRHPEHSSLALGAELVAGKAVALLDEADRARLDEVALPAAAAAWSVPDLVAEAERVLRGVSFDLLPPAASEVVIDLLDLVWEATHG